MEHDRILFLEVASAYRLISIKNKLEEIGTEAQTMRIEKLIKFLLSRGGAVW
ncbi:hypothetical protein ACSVDA_21190 [Cytobacillus sp. Hm23]